LVSLKQTGKHDSFIISAIQKKAGFKVD
jgi:hypothetical protein